MNARIDWADLAVFLAAAREGTLAAAALALHINASTVQRRIGKLEADLQTRLFDRSQRGYSLTLTGEELLEHALAIEEEVLAAGRRVAGRDRTVEGLVRLATVDDLAVSVLPPLLRSFRAAHPRVTVALDVQTDFADLSRQQADLAIRFGGKPKAGDVVARHIARVEVGLYGSEAYFREHGRPEAVADLARHTIVCGDERMAALPMERFIQRHADPARVAMRSNSMLARLAAVRDGIGIGILGCFMGEGERALERLDFPTSELTSDVWMLIHVDLRRNARVRTFADFLYDALVAQRSRFASEATGTGV